MTLVQAGKEKAGAMGWAVHFAGDQQIKWALDEDLRWARQALDGELQEASPWRSRIIHAAWWPSALRLGSDALRNQRVICFSDNAPSLYARQPEFYAVEPLVDKWIVRSRQAAAQFATLGIEAEWAPYCVDPKTFFRLPPNDTDLQALQTPTRIARGRVRNRKLSFRHGIHDWTRPAQMAEGSGYLCGNRAAGP